jgi:hypothetical protein
VDVEFIFVRFYVITTYVLITCPRTKIWKAIEPGEINLLALNFSGANTHIPAFSISPRVIFQWHLPSRLMTYFRTNPEGMKAAVSSVT